jgi:hypothetical protein
MAEKGGSLVPAGVHRIDADRADAATAIDGALVPAQVTDALQIL